MASSSKAGRLGQSPFRRLFTLPQWIDEQRNITVAGDQHVKAGIARAAEAEEGSLVPWNGALRDGRVLSNVEGDVLGHYPCLYFPHLDHGMVARQSFSSQTTDKDAINHALRTRGSKLTENMHSNQRTLVAVMHARKFK